MVSIRNSFLYPLPSRFLREPQTAWLRHTGKDEQADSYCADACQGALRRATMSKIYASFSDPHLAEKAAGALLDYGVRTDDLSLIRCGSANDFKNWAEAPARSKFSAAA